MAVLVVKAGSAVHNVSATFASGVQDSMAVVDGLAVLVAPVASHPAPYSEAAASVVATGATGRTVEHFQMPGTPTVAEPATCLAVVPATAGGGSASSGTGV